MILANLFEVLASLSMCELCFLWNDSVLLCSFCTEYCYLALVSVNADVFLPSDMNQRKWIMDNG